MFDSLTIKKQIIAGFIAVIALMLAIAAIAIFRVSAIDSNLAQINEVNSVKQRYAINFRGSVHDRAISLRDVILSETRGEAGNSIKEIRDLEAMYTESAGPLDAMLTPDTNPSTLELEILGRIKATESETNALVEQVIALQTSGNYDAASRIMRKQAAPLFTQWLGQINEFIDLQEASNKELTATTRDATSDFTWLLALIALGAVAISAFLIRWSTGPVRKLPEIADTIERLAKGARNIAIPSLGENNEVGQLAKSTQSLQNQLLEAENEKENQVSLIVDSVGTGLEELAAGNLTTRIKADLTGPFAKLKNDFNEAVSSLESTVSDMSATASSTNTGACEVRAASDDLSNRTQQQAARLEETAASMSQVTQSIQQTAQKAGQANAAILQTDEQAREGGSVVKEAVTAMSSIEQSSNDITQIIDVIDGIAFQTNLLALNAGVEAARAGESGKGFAVVANEVRALAQRSAEAAQDIKDLISKSSSHVSDGVNLVGKAGDLLQGIVSQIGKVTAEVNDIAQMANSQAENIGQVNATVGDMDRMTQQNAAMVEQTNATARSMSNEAEHLADVVKKFTVSSRIAPPAKRAYQNTSTVAPAQPPVPQISGNLALKADPALEADEQDWSEF